MPTIRKVTSKTLGVRWRAEVWINGKRQSKRFATKPEAVAWAYQREAELANDGRLVHGQTFGNAFARYAEEVSPKKRGFRAEIIRLNRLGRDPIALKQVKYINLEDADQYRDRRLKQVQASSVTREMGLMATVLRQAVKWRWISEYPWGQFEWPKKPQPRNKVYSQSEIERLKEVAGVGDDTPITNRSHQAIMAFLFSIETAARASEVTGLEWSDVDLKRRVAHLRETKNGESRDIPLSSAARAIIERMPRHHARPFALTPAVLSQVFMRIRKKAGIDDGTYHDSRRTACTRLAKKLEPMDLAKVSGHKDLKMLLNVYYRADAEALADLLD